MQLLNYILSISLGQSEMDVVTGSNDLQETGVLNGECHGHRRPVKAFYMIVPSF